MKSSTKSISKKIISALMCALMLAGICFATSGCGSEGETAGGKYVCGVQSGTTGWSYMTGDADWGFDGYANIETKSFDNGGLAVTDMLNGNVDFVVIDDAPAKSLAAANAGTKVIDIALTTESYGIAVAKDDAQLLADINAVLAAKAADIQALFDKYADVDDDNAASYAGETIPAGAYDSSKEQFVIATNAAFAPFEFKVGANFAGIDMELGKLIADALGQELVIVDMEFDSIVSAVGNNGIDAAITGMTINAKRKKTVNFSDPYYNEAYQVILCKDDCTLFDACKTTADLEAVLKDLSK